MLYNITTVKGEYYTFNDETEIITKDGVVIPSTKAEPIYSNNQDPSSAPIFSGIFLKDSKTILSLSGKFNNITDPNTLNLLI